VLLGEHLLGDLRQRLRGRLLQQLDLCDHLRRALQRALPEREHVRHDLRRRVYVPVPRRQQLLAAGGRGQQRDLRADQQLQRRM
jgi:hypothetical protein